MMPQPELMKAAKDIQLDPRTKIYLLLLINIVIFSTNPSGCQLIAKGALAAVPLALLCSTGCGGRALSTLSYMWQVNWPKSILPHMLPERGAF